MWENLDADHSLNGLVGMFHFSVDWLDIDTSDFYNDFMVKT